MMNKGLALFAVACIFLAPINVNAWRGHGHHHVHHGYIVPVIAGGVGLVAGVLAGSAFTRSAARPRSRVFRYRTGYDSGYEAGLRASRERRYGRAWSDGFEAGIRTGDRYD